MSAWTHPAAEPTPAEDRLARERAVAEQMRRAIAREQERQDARARWDHARAPHD